MLENVLCAIGLCAGGRGGPAPRSPGAAPPPPSGGGGWSGWPPGTGRGSTSIDYAHTPGALAATLGRAQGAGRRPPRPRLRLRRRPREATPHGRRRPSARRPASTSPITRRRGADAAGGPPGDPRYMPGSPRRCRGRGKAITEAIRSLQPGDVLMIAGRGARARYQDESGEERSDSSAVADFVTAPVAHGAGRILYYPMRPLYAGPPTNQTNPMCGFSRAVRNPAGPVVPLRGPTTIRRDRSQPCPLTDFINTRLLPHRRHPSPRFTTSTDPSANEARPRCSPTARCSPSRSSAPFSVSDTDIELYRRFRAHHADLFPHARPRLCRTTFVRQSAGLWAVKSVLWDRLVAMTRRDPKLSILDSFPVPVCRFARATFCPAIRRRGGLRLRFCGPADLLRAPRARPD